MLCVRAKLLQSCLTLCQRPLSMGFSRQEYWSGVPCPSPGDLPDPGIESASLTSPVLAGRFFFFYHWSNLGSSSQGSQICAIRGGAEFDENMIRLRAWQSSLFLGWSSPWKPSQHKALNKPQDVCTVLLCKPQKVLRFLSGQALYLSISFS